MSKEDDLTLMLILLVLAPILFFIAYKLLFVAMDKARNAMFDMSETLDDLSNSEDIKQTFRDLGEKSKKNRAEWSEIFAAFVPDEETDEQPPEPEPEIVFPPDELRPEHIMIVGGTGQGKTQYMQELLLRDLDTDYPIIVIDSQQSMLEKLLHVVPSDQLAYLNGAEPLAISPFDIGDTADDIKITNAISLYENMFAALDTELTAKQATVFRYITRLLVEVPGATFEDMLNILRFGTGNYSMYSRKLPTTVRQFLTEQLMEKSYDQTRQQVAERLYTLLENSHFARMFSAKQGRVNISKLIQQRQIILINTAQDKLGITGASLFGRFCLLQIGLEVLRRPETTDRILFYVDEAQEYFGESTVIARLFEQGRKRGLCMVCAFHRLGQLDNQLADLLRTNTSTKVVGGVNATDAAVLARDMVIPKDELISTPKLTFIGYSKGLGAQRVQVRKGLLEQQQHLTPRQLLSIKNQQRERFNLRNETPDRPPEPEIDPDAPQPLD